LIALLPFYLLDVKTNLESRGFPKVIPRELMIPAYDEARVGAGSFEAGGTTGIEGFVAAGAAAFFFAAASAAAASFASTSAASVGDIRR
jgi:hypothetical protein